MYLSRPIQACRLRISTCTIQNNNKSLNILPGRGHRRIIGVIVGGFKGCDCFDLWTNTCSSRSRLQVTGKVQEMHARNNCFSNFSLFPVKLVNLGGYAGAAPPPPPPSLFISRENLKNLKQINACVQTPLSPQEKSEKGQPTLRFFQRSGGGGYTG